MIYVFKLPYYFKERQIFFILKYPYLLNYCLNNATILCIFIRLAKLKASKTAKKK